MKFQLMSDLHTEFHAFPLKLLEKLTFEPDLDFLLIPGDIVVPCSQGKDKAENVLDFLSSKARHCIFVCGNHELYHGSKEDAENILESIMPSNFHWLKNSMEIVDGIRFFGGTMWFPDSKRNYLHERELSDFLVIKDFRKWVYEENRKFQDAARSFITDNTIVLTHHIPAYSTVPPIFQGDNLNRFFVCDMTELILERKPPLWVYGHTHLPNDSTIGNTRVVCWPYGYPSERPNLPPYLPVVFEI